MPPSFSGGLSCAIAAVAATSTSTDANAFENKRFMQVCLGNLPHCARPSCRCGNHAADDVRRQAALKPCGRTFFVERNAPFHVKIA
jgi:hypothetical protein